MHGPGTLLHHLAAGELRAEERRLQRAALRLVVVVAPPGLLARLLLPPGPPVSRPSHLSARLTYSASHRVDVGRGLLLGRTLTQHRAWLKAEI